MTLISGCNFYENRQQERIWLHAADFIGEYRLNTTESKFASYQDTALYKWLRLVIKSDTTYEFSMDLPFITDTIGRWTMEGFDVGQACHLLYQNTSYDQFVKHTNGSISTNYPRGKKNLPGVDYLYFNKVGKPDS